MPTTLAPPNGELVTQAWLAVCAGIPAGMIATKLAPIESWTDGGYLTVRTLSSGGNDVDVVERRQTIAQVDTWGARAGRVRPLWGVAATLMERIRLATTRDASLAWTGRPILMPVSGYQDARILGAYLTREPSRVEGDVSGYARFTTDLAVDWTV